MIIIGLWIAVAAAAPPPPCRPYVAGASLAEGARHGEAMAAAWPAQWRSRGRIGDAEMPPPALRRVVAALACTATWPGEEERTIRLALPLFGSRRHGDAAFTMLDALARSGASPGPSRAAAAGFRARMRHAVAREYDRI